MDWPQFQHDPQHTGNYGRGEILKLFIKSMINNTGTKIITGRLFIEVGKKGEISGLTQIKTIIDKQISVSAGSYLALDKEWATTGYFTPTETGEYSVYATLLDDKGNVIETTDGKLESSYEFEVVS